MAVYSCCRRHKLKRGQALPKQGLCQQAEFLRLDGDDFGRIDQDEAAMLATILEADDARYLREEGIVLAAADVQAGLERCAALADDDAAAQNCLAAKHLDAEPLRV